MLRTQVYLREEQARELKLLANSSGKNFSELIREGVDLVIKKKTRRSKGKRHPLYDLVGIIKGGKKSNSTKDINDYYKNFK